MTSSPLLRALAASVLVATMPAQAAEVTMSGPRFAALQPTPSEPDRPGPFVHSARVELRQRGEQVVFRATYAVHVPDEAQWLPLAIAPADAHLTRVTFAGRAVPTTEGLSGLHAVLRPTRDGTLVVEGTVERGLGADLGLLHVPGVIEVPSDLTVQGGIPRGDGTVWVPAGPLALIRPSSNPEAGDLVFGEVAVGLTISDAEVNGQAELRWRIARGSRDVVEAVLPGVGSDLELTGPQIASWARSGDRLTITLGEPESRLVQVSARWSARLPSGDEARVSVPTPGLPGTFRTTHALQLARDGTQEVVPSVAGSPVATSSLPTWAVGLVQGQPTASFLSEQAVTGHVQVLQVTPAPGPPTLIDVAAYRVATTAEGRVLIRAHYAVRNDRGAVLRLVPPRGARVVSVRVAGETAKLARSDEAVLVPLARSVETLQGLVTFPVEVTLLGEAAAWPSRGAHDLQLPIVDAPIAVARATVFLPPERRSGRRTASSRIVQEFTKGDGITYGFAVGDARASQADALFQGAVSAWMSNDFSEAQTLIDDLRVLGGSNKDVERLQSNLTYVLEGDSTGADVAQARRVKEMARARSESDVVEQDRVIREAEDLYAAGDYEQAEQAWSEALQLGDKLARVAADEDVDVRTQNQVVEKKLAEVRAKIPRKDAPSSPDVDLGGEESVVFSFDDDEISGELVAPEGQFLEVAESPPEPEPEPVVFEESMRETKASFAPARSTGKKRKGASRRQALDAPEQPHEAGASPSPAVTAASASVVVPELGEAVLYQRLLLPAGAPDEVPLVVRPRRKR